MTKKEYFQQAAWLDKQIRSLLAEADYLKPYIGEHITIEMAEKRARVQAEKLIRKKEEIRAVIEALPSMKERLALRCRYLCGMQWDDIAAELDVDPRTARRWHDEGLKHAQISELASSVSPLAWDRGEPPSPEGEG